jgi:hypothetical protein
MSGEQLCELLKETTSYRCEQFVKMADLSVVKSSTAKHTTGVVLHLLPSAQGIWVKLNQLIDVRRPTEHGGTYGSLVTHQRSSDSASYWKCKRSSSCINAAIVHFADDENNTFKQMCFDCNNKYRVSRGKNILPEMFNISCHEKNYMLRVIQIHESQQSNEHVLRMLITYHTKITGLLTGTPVGNPFDMFEECKTLNSLTRELKKKGHGYVERMTREVAFYLFKFRFSSIGNLFPGGVGDLIVCYVGPDADEAETFCNTMLWHEYLC